MSEQELRSHRCCFTGHRPEKLKRAEDEIKKGLEEAILKAIRDGYTTFITGMARGVDIWAGQIVLRLRQNNPDLRLIAALPYPGCDNRWPASWRKQFAEVLAAADLVKAISPTYSMASFQKRDEWMVDQSSRVIAVYDGVSGGTKNTMTCAVYYKLSSASAWTLSQSVSPVNYGVSKTNLLLSPTFNALSSYDIKVAVTDFFTSSTPVEQEVSVSTKQVMQDFYRDGTGVAFGKVAETPNAAEFAWKLVASDAQIDTMRMKTYTSVAQLGQTVGSATINGCRSAMSDGSILMAQASDFASAELPSTIGTILLGRIHNIRSFCLFMGKEPATGMFKQALDSAGTSFTGTWYRVYDSASVIPVSGGGTGQTSAAGIRNAIGLGNTTGALPIANGGHGATSAKQGLNSLGIFYSATLPASGTDGQVCLVPVS